MQTIKEKYKMSVTPLAKKEAIIQGEKYRFTVLTDRLIRIEYNENGVFEDRATQVVVNRSFDVPEFEVKRDEEKIEIVTRHMLLTYYTGRVFTANSLFAKFEGRNANSWNNWYYGSGNKKNLKGTVRTLDEVDGECELDDGILSRNNFVQMDDSHSLILEENGLLNPREEGAIDLYLFGYAHDYYAALKDFYILTGSTPLIPRYALGNMWSRYYRYTQQEYIDLMDRFKKEGCPFSVAVIDMDWHLVYYDLRYGDGWTGYTWDKKLFPDYKKFLKDLHERDLEVTLNLHPSDGVAPYEDMYQQMADAMGVTDGTTVKFDITDPKFIENYFEILHHPYEKDGVSFWWMDWQQGNNTKVENLDPLWMLNHYHMLDMKNDNKRPIMLSRYSGLGSHRYPIGFSGDTVVTWNSLDFQPYFTATASNAGYTWWSHDIGGHMCGVRDDEMVARWVQLGVFSPINRLHSTAQPLMGKEPWNYSKDAEAVMKSFLRLRHELIPYLYTMNYRTYKYAKPLIAPLYYNHPHCAEAYAAQHRNEYYFGTQMIVSPITQPADLVTHSAYATTYIPEGEWIDFFTGRRYKGGKTLRLYRDLYTMPVLVKAGGIIPMANDGIKNSTANPENLKIRVFSGNDNTFELYEDDGISNNYETGSYATTKFELKDKKEFIIYAPEGDTSVIPENRCYTVEFNGYDQLDGFEVTENGKALDFETAEEDGKISVFIKNAKGTVRIQFTSEPTIRPNNTMLEAIEFTRRYYGDTVYKSRLYSMLTRKVPVAQILISLAQNEVDANVFHALTEILTALD